MDSARARFTYTMSRTQTSGFGTIGAAFLYFDALKRHAIASVELLFFVLVSLKLLLPPDS